MGLAAAILRMNLVQLFAVLLSPSCVLVHIKFMPLGEKKTLILFELWQITQFAIIFPILRK